MIKHKLSKKLLKERWGKDGRKVRIFVNYYLINKSSNRTILSEEISIVGRIICLLFFVMMSPLYIPLIIFALLGMFSEWFFDNIKIVPNWFVNPFRNKVLRFDDIMGDDVLNSYKEMIK